MCSTTTNFNGHTQLEEPGARNDFIFSENLPASAKQHLQMNHAAVSEDRGRNPLAYFQASDHRAGSPSHSPSLSSVRRVSRFPGPPEK